MFNKKPMIVEVTKEDIRQGVRHEPTMCPVAVAAGRAMNKPMVASSYMIRSLDGEHWFFTPPEASRFIYLFDERGPEAVSPLTFTLERKL